MQRDLSPQPKASAVEQRGAITRFRRCLACHPAGPRKSDPARWVQCSGDEVTVPASLRAYLWAVDKLTTPWVQVQQKPAISTHLVSSPSLSSFACTCNTSTGIEAFPYRSTAVSTECPIGDPGALASRSGPHYRALS
jgi:hypothetical protein